MKKVEIHGQHVALGCSLAPGIGPKCGQPLTLCEAVGSICNELAETIGDSLR